MRAILYCYGSRGDVQPYAALAAGLVRAGHSATLVAPARFAPLAAPHGVDFFGLNEELLQLLDLPEVQQMYLRDAKPTQESRTVAMMLRERSIQLYPVLLEESWRAAEAGADIVIHSQSNAEALHQIAERLRVPRVLAVLYPFYVPSRYYPSTLLGSFGSRPKLLNRLSHAASSRRRPLPEFGTAAERWRTSVLGLPTRGDALAYRRWSGGDDTAVVLHGFSRHILPPAPDWPTRVHTLGGWTLPEAEAWEPSRELVEFLGRGASPVFVGFGSLVGVDPARTGRHVVSAIRAAGLRAVVVTGCGAVHIPDPPEEILVTREVPYPWLFRQVRLAVHSGGSGTLHAATAAGLPQVACPFHREQTQWSRRLHRLGVAPPPLHQLRLTAERLSAAIHAVDTDPRYRRQARMLGQRMAAESGVTGAVRILEKLATR